MKLHRAASRRPVALFPVLTLAWLAAPLAASAQVGVRAGVSANPDQFVLGGHVETSPIVDRLRFRPNLEIGLGDNVTLVAINAEFVYEFPIKHQPWRVYVGGGPAINIYSFDAGGPHHDTGNDTDVEPGFNLLVGLEHERGFFTEFKVGTIDSPDVKFIVGYTFR